MNTRGHNEDIEVSSKGKTSDFGSENRGSIPLTSTKMEKIDFTKLAVKTAPPDEPNPCHLCCLAEKKRRVTHTRDGRYKSHSKWKCNLPLNEGCALRNNQYYVEKQI